MRLLVKFKKFGPAKYISHLDVQRAVRRALRRAEIPVQYSKGFNPHMQLSFASPLPVGMESEGDYVEIALTKAVDSERALARLGRHLPGGLTAVSAGALPEDCGKISAMLKRAAYGAVMYTTKFHTVEKAVDTLMRSESAVVETASKKGVKKIDIRPRIHSMNTKRDNYVMIDMVLGASAETFLKPQTVLKEILRISALKADCGIKRTALYFDDNGQIVTFDALMQDGAAVPVI